MRAVKLLVEPYEFINFVKLESKKELNQHGILQLTGLIKKDKEEEYLKRAEEETWVSIKVVSDEGEEERFFEGILTGLKIQKQNQVSYLTLELKTGSYLLDLKSHIRSFQDAGLSYGDIISICMKGARGKYIILEKGQERPQRFFLQYNETDWEFLKRMASYAGIAIIPESEVPGKKIYFGYRSETILESFSEDNYEILQNYISFIKKKVSGIEKVEGKGAISYLFRTREIYRLGEHVKFKGQDFVIGKIRSWLERQELCHEYLLVTPKNGLPQIEYNENLIGASLKADVVAVDKTKIQIEIQKDENKNGCGKRWFEYATVYSTPDGTGWYCMPEVGDTVRLVFPSKKECESYTASAIHLEERIGRCNPNEKSWKNRHGKEILFTPDSVCLKNNNGLLVELSDEKGINIVSNKDIVIQSMGDLQVKSREEGIQMSAVEQIIIQQGAAKIQMKDAIYIGGGKVYMN